MGPPEPEALRRVRIRIGSGSGSILSPHVHPSRSSKTLPGSDSTDCDESVVGQRNKQENVIYTVGDVILSN